MSETPAAPGRPIVLAPGTYRRHAEAVEVVEQTIATRAPRPGTGRFPGVVPGAWGLLYSGDVITAASGASLGTGRVTLCDRSGVPGDPPDVVDVYNAGRTIEVSPYASARIVRLGWTGGEWAVTCPGGSS